MNIRFQHKHGDAFVSLRPIPTEDCLKISVLSGKRKGILKTALEAEKPAWESL